MASGAKFGACLPPERMRPEGRRVWMPKMDGSSRPEKAVPARQRPPISALQGGYRTFPVPGVSTEVRRGGWVRAAGCAGAQLSGYGKFAGTSRCAIATDSGEVLAWALGPAAVGRAMPTRLGAFRAGRGTSPPRARSEARRSCGQRTRSRCGPSANSRLGLPALPTWRGTGPGQTRG